MNSERRGERVRRMEREERQGNKKERRERIREERLPKTRGHVLKACSFTSGVKAGERALENES